MIAYFEETGCVSEFRTQMEQFEANPAVKGILILSCEQNNYEPNIIDPIICSLSKPVLGGIFPGIIYGKKKYEKGSLILAIDQTPSVHLVRDLSDPEGIMQEKLLEMILSNQPGKTQMIFVDGLSKRIGELLESLFLVNGLEFNFIGGGAGSISLVQKPCIFTNEGLLADAVAIGIIQTPIGIGIKHGWNSIAGPFMVTKAEGNIIKTIDFKPAFEVYKNVLETIDHTLIDQHNFFEVAKAYPFGINRLGSEKVVRDPIAVTENGELICVGEVQKGSFIDILNGNHQSLIEAAEEAFEVSKAQYGNKQRNFTLLIDCISRTLFMGERFNEELEAIHEPTIPLIGALTIGEIGNSGTDYIEFYNKTTVVGSF